MHGEIHEFLLASHSISYSFFSSLNSLSRFQTEPRIWNWERERSEETETTNSQAEDRSADLFSYLGPGRYSGIFPKSCLLVSSQLLQFIHHLQRLFQFMIGNHERCNFKAGSPQVSPRQSAYSFDLRHFPQLLASSDDTLVTRQSSGGFLQNIPRSLTGPVGGTAPGGIISSRR